MRLLGVCLRPVPVALFALALVTHVAAAGLSGGLEPAYDTILFGAVAQAVAGGLIAGILVAAAGLPAPAPRRDRAPVDRRALSHGSAY